MKSILERLTVILDHNNDPVYAEPEIRSIATHMIDLPGGLLAVCEDSKNGSWTEVVLFRFSMGPATRDGVEVTPACYQRVFHGEGPSGVLRELRHTFWGEPDNSGYIFYPSGELITEGFKALQRWFDV